MRNMPVARLQALSSTTGKIDALMPSQSRRDFGFLSVALVACAAVAVTLGTFALVGDRMGLWDPIEPSPFPTATPTPKKHLRGSGTAPHRVRLPPARSVSASQPSSVEPPLPAGIAFLFAAVAAALAALISARGRRLLSRGFSGRVKAVPSQQFDAASASQRWKSSVAGMHPRLPRARAIAITSAVAGRTTQVGATLLGAVKAERGRFRPSTHNPTRATSSGTAKAALQATAFRLGQARQSYMRHQTAITPYAISVVIGVALGWLVVVLTNQ